jgi:hypothetical protein
MQLISRIAFALFFTTMLTNGAHAQAGGPEASPQAESEAIEGQESPPLSDSGAGSKTGAGPTGASDPAMESEEIDDAESPPLSASGAGSETGAGPTGASDPAMESKEIKGQE